MEIKHWQILIFVNTSTFPSVFHLLAYSSTGTSGPVRLPGDVNRSKLFARNSRQAALVVSSLSQLDSVVEAGNSCDARTHYFAYVLVTERSDYEWFTWGTERSERREVFSCLRATSVTNVTCALVKNSHRKINLSMTIMVRSRTKTKKWAPILILRTCFQWLIKPLYILLS